MTDPNDNAFAMPAVFYPNGHCDYGAFGLTKREFFAAAALQGLLANRELVGECSKAKIAELAVSFASQLIEELNS